MGERKSKEYLDKVKQKYGVDELWSWSKYHSYKIDPYGWYLTYIKHEKQIKSSIYGVAGEYCHNCIEDFYTKKISYDEMSKQWDDNKYAMELAELKFNRVDEKKNKQVADKYIGNIDLFFQEHIPIKGKVICEQFVSIKISDSIILQGYIDFVNKEGDTYIITDWKTSTRYQGKKVLEERGQLLIYAEALRQLGVALENIKIRWNFLKYCNVDITTTTKDKETKLEKVKTKACLRASWVEECAKDITKLLEKKTDFDEVDIIDMVEVACENNNLNNLPKEIQDRFVREDCYVYVPLDQESIEELKQDIIDTVNEIKEKEKEYNETQDDRLFWTEIDAGNQYYFNNLCGFDKSVHKPYAEYLETVNMFIKKDNKEEKKQNKSKACEDDMSWLNDL